MVFTIMKYAKKELLEFLRPCYRQLIKINDFGFSSKFNYISDIVKSIYMFSELSEDSINSITSENKMKYFTSGDIIL